MDVEIPANTTATVYLPAADTGAITESNAPLSLVKDIKVTGTEDGYVVIRVGSGKYQFIIATK
jgi:alpha-L-rhamnosidase